LSVKKGRRAFPTDTQTNFCMVLLAQNCFS
jgi:hypothetical protein